MRGQIVGRFINTQETGGQESHVGQAWRCPGWRPCPCLGHLYTLSSCFQVDGGQGAILCLFLLSCLQLKIILMPKWPVLRWHVLLPFIYRDFTVTWIGLTLGLLFVPHFFYFFLL